MGHEKSKQSNAKRLTIEQKYLTKTLKLELNRERCFGCGFCEIVCPKEAITLSKAVAANGRLSKKPEVDIDIEKCVLCGTCIVFCPSKTLRKTTDDNEDIPVVEYEVTPMLKKAIKIDSTNCNIECQSKCQKSCPFEAIKVKTSVERNEARITGVDVDEKLCIYCKLCEVNCPFGLITVDKTFEGIMEIETTKCPGGCQVCVDICPSKALELDNKNKPVVNKEFCIFCSACEKACPENIINVKRTSIACSEIKSGAWFKILEKLTSSEVLARELGRRAANNRHKVVKERTI